SSGAIARESACSRGEISSTTLVTPTPPSVVGCRERASWLDKRCLGDRRPSCDQFAAEIDVVPYVPEEESAWPLRLIDIRDDPLAIGLLPIFDRVEARVDL